ncbi:hypothetical protein BDV95DRAFT_609806 [Massariosphaeria phaeospora]|uniref:F-box domain-containing protein n=1 Tax=Massariosphaeria phaeospora TaxID=100035 RepID=A0A7C8M4K1_9PLEO|nr:hypothetical protein BDV95DRAFT_609806 [Massariosphaeria phaeospora]
MSIQSTQLIELAPELLELILSFLGPRDVVSFGRTCQRANPFIQPRNQLLWRSAFLHLFDDPNHAWTLLMPAARAKNRRRESTWDWFVELSRRLKASKAVCQPSNADLVTNPELAITTFLDIVETASYSFVDDSEVHTMSLNVDFLERLFATAPNPEKIVHDYHYRHSETMSLPLHLLTEPNRPITRSMMGRRVAIPDWASRFHIFYGITSREEDSIRAKAAARAIVYDWAVSGPSAEHGPLVQDNSGTVNWQTLEAISSLMHRIFEIARSPHIKTPSGFRNNIARPMDVLDPDDWAGVSRTWLGTYAFLDYRALAQYNFANQLEYPLDLGAYEESCGDLMRLELDIDNSDELQQDPRLQIRLPYCQDLPILHFSGTSSRSPPGRPLILVRGCVCLVPGGREVRWRFIINYAGEDQWQLEGVQPGGIRAGGIYGLWSHVDHDENGPSGPFYYAPIDLCKDP